MDLTLPIGSKQIQNGVVYEHTRAGVFEKRTPTLLSESGLTDIYTKTEVNSAITDIGLTRAWIDGDTLNLTVKV